MRLGINRMRHSSESAGSHPGNPDSPFFHCLEVRADAEGCQAPFRTATATSKIPMTTSRPLAFRTISSRVPGRRSGDVAEQAEANLEVSEDRHSEQGAEDTPRAAGDARAAEHDTSDDLKFQPLPRVGTATPPREYTTPRPLPPAGRSGIEPPEPPRHGDRRELGRGTVVADGIERAAEARRGARGLPRSAPPTPAGARAGRARPADHPGRAG